MIDSLRITIPISPGIGRVNGRFTMRRRGKGGSAFPGKTASYQRFVDAVAKHAGAAARSSGVRVRGPASVSVTQWWPEARHLDDVDVALGDVDGPLKAILDGLQAGGVLDDDARVVEVHARKRVDRERPRVEILVSWAPLDGVAICV